MPPIFPNCDLNSHDDHRVSNVQFEVTITLKLERSRHYCFHDIFEPLPSDNSEKTLCLDRETLKDRDLAFETLGNFISEGRFDHNNIKSFIDNIINLGIEYSSLPCNKELDVIPIEAEIGAILEEHVNHELDPDRLRRVLEESAAMENNYNHVDQMVPAEKSSVKKLLKRVGVEGDEGEITKKRRVDKKCVICLDELEDGSSNKVYRMPCSHTFHGSCIKKWLDHSHYCPLCRFEMPTSKT